jgi:hypothetical protein
MVLTRLLHTENRRYCIPVKNITSFYFISDLLNNALMPWFPTVLQVMLFDDIVPVTKATSRPIMCGGGICVEAAALLCFDILYQDFPRAQFLQTVDSCILRIIKSVCHGYSKSVCVTCIKDLLSKSLYI